MTLFRPVVGQQIIDGEHVAEETTNLMTAWK
jgi:hypothetical protein